MLAIGIDQQEFLGRCFCGVQSYAKEGQTGLFAALQNCPVCVGSCQTSFSALSWRGHSALVPGDSVLNVSDPCHFLGPELMGWGWGSLCGLEQTEGRGG